jgi:hypothetical protein
MEPHHEAMSHVPEDGRLLIDGHGPVSDDSGGLFSVKISSSGFSWGGAQGGQARVYR